MNLYVPSLSVDSYQHMANIVSTIIPTSPQLHWGLDYFKATQDFLTIPAGDVLESNKHESLSSGNAWGAK